MCLREREPEFGGKILFEKEGEKWQRWQVEEGTEVKGRSGGCGMLGGGGAKGEKQKERRDVDKVHVMPGSHN